MEILRRSRPEEGACNMKYSTKGPALTSLRNAPAALTGIISCFAQPQRRSQTTSLAFRLPAPSRDIIRQINSEELKGGPLHMHDCRVGGYTPRPHIFIKSLRLFSRRQREPQQKMI